MLHIESQKTSWKETRGGSWTNQRPRTRGTANQLQRQQEVTSGYRFGSSIPPASFAKRIYENAAMEGIFFSLF